MHQINVLIFGPSSFLITLNELKSFLKFNYFTEKSNADYDVILFHEDFLTDKKAKDLMWRNIGIVIGIILGLIAIWLIGMVFSRMFNKPSSGTGGSGSDASGGGG